MLQRMLVILILAASATCASAQVFNPATPTVPSPPPPSAPPSGMGPPPAVIGRSSEATPPGVIGRNSGSPRSAGKSITPGVPARETHNDRSIRCAHQGAALGVPPGARGQYVQECVNN
jgi:hypothetical protein